MLGAPLIHDFALISLSDLMTPWEKIEKRLLCASEADFVICLYNPSSRKRHDYLQKACDLMMQHKSPETVCGTVQSIGRDGRDHAGDDLKRAAGYSGGYVYHRIYRKFSDTEYQWAHGDAKRIRK